MFECTLNSTARTYTVDEKRVQNSTEFFVSPSPALHVPESVRVQPHRVPVPDDVRGGVSVHQAGELDLVTEAAVHHGVLGRDLGLVCEERKTEKFKFLQVKQGTNLIPSKLCLNRAGGT